MTRLDATDPDLGASGAEVLASRLIHCDVETFAEQYWGARPLLTRGADDYSDLLSPAIVDSLLSEHGLRTPFLRVAKNGATLPDSSFTAPAGVGAGIGDQLDDTALWRQFADGATLVLQALHRTWQPIVDLSSRLGTELGHPVQANAYITPPQNQGFDAHYDVHDVFVLQTVGSKRWIIHEPVLTDPLRDEPWSDRKAQVAEAAAGEPLIDTVLEPGDALYLPRGWLHSAKALGEVSVHLTLGIHVWTGYALAEQLTRSALDLLRDDPDVRATLELGVDHPLALDLIRQRLLDAIAVADPGVRFQQVRRSQARPAPLGPLAQLAALNGLTEQSRLRLRPALTARIEGDRLTSRAGWLALGPTEKQAMQALMTAGESSAADLGTDFARRLLRAGIVLPADR
ncbi:cupin domain-containing protein [Naumannella halotolerans]|uniref:Cupin superfamily protein n=1 Tax=Naumannella halotolerans TaxID=993414 RepID=A0A4R7J603_9ACTN|nr:cupin domain-containing protein [Naumannella halotolerans]TDT32790.1 Cupin superfamily protein [Naumannella halotolerans]